MSRRPLLLLPVLLAATALPTATALAGEDDDDPTLRVTQGCVSGDRAKAVVRGDDIDTVEFSLDGTVVKTVNRATVRGTYVLGMRCASLSVGAHRGRAVVTFEGGERQTLRFQVTRSAQGSPRFTG